MRDWLKKTSGSRWKRLFTAPVSKLLFRHPHVFHDATLESFGHSKPSSMQSVKQAWEAKKVDERADRGQLDLFDDIPMGSPALTRAHKIQKRATSIGFDWSSIAGVLSKMTEERLRVGRGALTTKPRRYS